MLLVRGEDYGSGFETLRRNQCDSTGKVTLEGIGCNKHTCFIGLLWGLNKIIHQRNQRQLGTQQVLNSHYHVTMFQIERADHRIFL